MKRFLISMIGLCLLTANICQAQNYVQEGNAYFDKGDYEKAKQMFRAEILNGTTPGMEKKMELCDDCIKLLTIADFLFSDSKNYSEAKSKYTELLSFNPKDPYAKKQLEECNKQLGVTTTSSGGSPSASNANLKEKIIIEWADIPAGTFLMGSSTREEGRSTDEHQHQVSLNSFKMSKHAITFEQYDVFCEATKRSKPTDEGWGRGKRPVINISWEDAVAFTKWIGGGCRLPTEAEWEYACRAGSTTPYYTGNILTTSQANYDGDHINRNNPKGVFRKQTLPVGNFSPNAWGLYNMHGNVYEWCHDWYDANYYKNSPLRNPQGPSYGKTRVLRGGSWLVFGINCRSAARRNYAPTSSRSSVGFRIVVPK